MKALGSTRPHLATPGQTWPHPARPGHTCRKAIATLSASHTYILLWTATVVMTAARPATKTSLPSAIPATPTYKPKDTVTATHQLQRQHSKLTYTMRAKRFPLTATQATLKATPATPAAATCLHPAAPSCRCRSAAAGTWPMAVLPMRQRVPWFAEGRRADPCTSHVGLSRAFASRGLRFAD